MSATQPSTQPSGPSERYRALATADRTQLESALRRGARPDPEALSGWLYRGYNTPWITRLLGFQKFVKGFDHDERGPYGYNLFVTAPRSGLDGPWEPKGRPHGFYDLRTEPTGRWRRYPNALGLDYGGGRNAPWNPEALLRDFLVEVTPGDPTLLLGKAYLSFGLVWVPVSFFLLERWRPAAELLERPVAA